MLHLPRQCFSIWTIRLSCVCAKCFAEMQRSDSIDITFCFMWTCFIYFQCQEYHTENKSTIKMKPLNKDVFLQSWLLLKSIVKIIPCHNWTSGIYNERHKAGFSGTLNTLRALSLPTQLFTGLSATHQHRAEENINQFISFIRSPNIH